MPRLWLINQFANTPDLPGHTRQYEVAVGLAQRGWQVEVLASDFNLTQRCYRRLRWPMLSFTERLAGIRWTWLWVSPYRRNNWQRQINQLSFCLHLWLRLLPAACFGRLTGSAPDLILASSPQLPAAFTVLWIARLIGIPLVLELRDLWPQVLIDQGGYLASHPMVSLLRWMEGVLYRQAALVVVLAKGAEFYVRDRGALRTAWLPNGPDLELFQAQSLPPSRSQFCVLYAGAHGDANALDNVIEAARWLDLHGASILLRLVGDGPEKPALILQSAGLTNISFEAPVPKAAMPGLMGEVDAILLSLRDVPLFRYGVSPNKLYDAYAMGRPVVTTVPGAINDEVCREAIGLAVQPGDPVALANALLQLAATPLPERQAMARRARYLAETIYSRQRIIGHYDQLLRACITR